MLICNIIENIKRAETTINHNKTLALLTTLASANFVLVFSSLARVLMTSE